MSKYPLPPTSFEKSKSDPVCLLFRFQTLDPTYSLNRNPTHALLPIPNSSLSKANRRLQTAQIIPDVLDAFAPKVRLVISWRNVSADIGNDVRVDAVQEVPFIEVVLLEGGERGVGDDDAGMREKGLEVVVALTDPDAPSREDPEWSQICHWIVYGIRAQSHTKKEVGLEKMDVQVEVESAINHDHYNDKKAIHSHDNNIKPHHLTILIPYKPPAPPPKTGKHRYVFMAMTPANRSTETLHLSRPKDRRHWGYGDGKERVGVREWMVENGLVGIGANFVYAQNEEQ
ncbi:phosphatidylethanolamine-binding protein [Delphinella strobiligena]|nr:phosphatidylethanolamine-binding protein [Delphinella strobiligena]